MKNLKMLLPAALIAFSMNAKAELTEVPQSEMNSYKEAVLLKLADRQMECVHWEKFLNYSSPKAYKEVLEYLISHADKIMVDTQNLSPALIFQVPEITSKKAQPNAKGYSTVSISIRQNQKYIAKVEARTYELTTVNNGTLVKPVIALGYVELGSLICN